MSDGTRTRDHRDHNPELYQLSYAHRGGFESSSEATFVVKADAVIVGPSLASTGHLAYGERARQRQRICWASVVGGAP